MSKPNGRPKSERNIQIIEDYKAGMTSLQLEAKYGITHGYAQKLGSEYRRKDRIFNVEYEKNTCALYGKRDLLLINAYRKI